MIIFYSHIMTNMSSHNGLLYQDSRNDNGLLLVFLSKVSNIQQLLIQGTKATSERLFWRNAGYVGGMGEERTAFPTPIKMMSSVVMAEPERVNIDLTVKNTPRSVCSRLLNATNKQENEKRIQVYWDNDIPWASKAGVICASVNVTFYSERKRNAFKDLMCGTGPPRQLQIWGKCSKDDVIIYPSCTRREQKQFTVPQDLLINKSPLREAQSSHRL